MRSPTKFLAILLLLLPAKGLFAQHTVDKGDVVINIYDQDSFINKFIMNIYKKGNEVKINYAYWDSTKRSEIQKDPKYQTLANHKLIYHIDDPRRIAAADSLADLFERYAVYTKDSVTVDLKRDKAYRNLLTRITKSSRAELLQKTNHRFIDGDSPQFTIITKDDTKTIYTSTPVPNETVLYNLLVSSLDKGGQSNAVQKIKRKFDYPR